MKWFTAFFHKWISRLGGEVETDEEEELTFTEETDLNYERDPFLHSLRHLTGEDIPLAVKAENGKKSSGGNGLRKAVMILCALVFVGSIVYLIDNFIQKAEAESLYGEAAAEFDAAGLDFDFAFGEKEDSTVRTLSQSRADSSMMNLTDSIKQLESTGEIVREDAGEHNEQLEKLRALLGTYKVRNEDVCSYISIPGVDLSYVVVQGDDNDYYLNHNYKKEYLVVGSIYMDYRNVESLADNHNTVLYGHNIENPGIMFHRVTDFFDKEVFAEELIYLYTMDGVFVYKPFAIYSTRPNSGYIRTDFATDAEFVQFCTEMQARSQVKSDVQFDGSDRILTLSTCTNYNDGRYALHAYLVECIK